MSNSIAIARDLSAAGVEPKAANAIAEAVVTHAGESHATKAELEQAKGDTKAEVNALRNEFSEFRAEVRGEFKAVHIKFASVFAVMLVSLAAVVGIYFKGVGG